MFWRNFFYPFIRTILGGRIAVRAPEWTPISLFGLWCDRPMYPAVAGWINKNSTDGNAAHSHSHTGNFLKLLKINLRRHLRLLITQHVCTDMSCTRNTRLRGRSSGNCALICDIKTRIYPINSLSTHTCTREHGFTKLQVDDISKEEILKDLHGTPGNRRYRKIARLGGSGSGCDFLQSVSWEMTMSDIRKPTYVVVVLPIFIHSDEDLYG